MSVNHHNRDQTLQDRCRLVIAGCGAVLLAGGLALLVVAGRGLGGMASAQEGRTARNASAAKPLREPGIENLFQLSDRLYSGGQPAGEEGFATLQKLGIRTIISVDGTPPDIDLAQRYGLRYVHLPISYDGLRRDKLPLMIKAARELPGPIFVHCHHGKHRGPAAAAACAIGTEKWSRSQAAAWLRQAGTDPAYKGLYRDVKELTIPGEQETSALAPDFPESVPAPSLVEAMLEIDRLHDQLLVLEQRNWKPAAGDRSAPAELAVQLLEHYRELGRSPELERLGSEFQTQVQGAEQGVDRLRATLERLAGAPAGGNEFAKAREALQGVAKGCRSCHAEFRDVSNR